MKVTCSICGKRREMASELSFDGTYWYAFCRECAPATLNIKDHIRNGERMPVTDWHEARQ